MFSLITSIAKWASDQGWARLFGLTIALKFLIMTAGIFILAPILKWVSLWGIEQTMDVVNGASTGTSLEGFTFQATGLMAYFFTVFQLPECFTILSAAMILRFSIKPFGK